MLTKGINKMSKDKNLESSIMDILKIDDWKNIKPQQITGLIELSPEIDKESFEKILQQIPNIVENSKDMIDGIVNIVNSSKEMSSETKEVYKQMINAIRDILNKDGNDTEINNKLIDIMDKIREDIKELDKSDKEHADKQTDKIIQYGEKAFVVLVVGIALRAGLKKTLKI